MVQQGHAVLGPGGYFARGGLDSRLHSLGEYTIEAWVDVGWRHKESTLVTLLVLSTGAFEALAVLRTDSGIQLAFNWKDSIKDGGQRYQCASSAVPVEGAAGTLTHLAVALHPINGATFYVNGGAGKSCPEVARRRLKILDVQKSALLLGELPTRRSFFCVCVCVQQALM